MGESVSENTRSKLNWQVYRKSIIELLLLTEMVIFSNSIPAIY